MAAKRSATSELNHDNWNEEEEREDSGTFQRASEDSLKRRIIKTARRRNPISSVRSGDTDVKSAFTGFTAFTKAAVPPTASTFSFLSNITNEAEKPETNGKSVKEAEKKIHVVPSSSNKSIFPDAKESTTKSNDYFSKLKGLNENVASWIKRHVDANPLINLQPIFRDYEQYFKELEKEGPKAITNDVDKKKKDEKHVLVQHVHF
ncbi:hypothetical protein NQ318_020728 [Aromia moschata]|uniref:Nuclear pore complex NUP2/50/61 domain-containing protein n=1 Tax=Aromia moschata TaxID=1265417 RepID=A0AAV8YXC2_9CUCU|nr:hypothetical protein NQ318_020728 [Aromia moschata]